MRHSAKVALGGIIAALSLTLLVVVSLFPFMTYALPAIASALLCLIVIEIGKKWAFGVYAAVGILAMLLGPDKEVAMLYCTFFGYYPILKALLESHLPRWGDMLVKLLVFCGTMLGSYYLMIRFMGIQFEDLDSLGIWAIPILLALGLFAFVCYDFALTQLISIYEQCWRKRFQKLFRR